jgi:hypothetical protein
MAGMIYKLFIPHITRSNSIERNCTMGLFSTILDKLGLNKKKEAEAAQAEALARMAKNETEARAKMKEEAEKVAASAAKPAPANPVTTAPATPAVSQPAKMAEEEAHAEIRRDAQPVVQAISEVDVVKQLEQMAEGSGLDWKVSIVDLLKVLKIDSSLTARKELAEELGCPAELMGGDHSKMNIWLHKTVLKKIAENGGNIPANLLD